MSVSRTNKEKAKRAPLWSRRANDGAHPGALAERHELIRLAIDNSPCGIAILDLDDDLKVVTANTAFTQMLQRDVEQVLGLHPWDWDESADVKGRRNSHYCADDQRYVTTPRRSATTRWRRADATLIDVHIEAASFVLQGRRYAYLVCEDISEGGQDPVCDVEAECWRMAFEASHDGMVIVSLDDQRIVRANAAFVELVGRPRSRFAGSLLSQWDMRLARDASWDLMAYAGTEQHEPQWVVESELRREDGGLVPVEVSASCSAIAGRLHANIVYRNIEWKKALQERLNVTNRQFRSFFDATRRFIAAYTVDGKPVAANAAALVFAGADQPSRRGHLFWEGPWWCDDEDRLRLKAGFWRAVKGESVRLEIMQRDMRGRLHAKDLSLEPIRDDSGKITLVLAESNDISALKSAQASLMEAKEFATATIAAMSDGLIRTDSDGRIELCNDAAAKLLGGSVTALTGRPCNHLFTVFDHGSGARLPHPVNVLLSDKRCSRITTSGSVRGLDGRFRPMTLSCVRLSDPTGASGGAVLVLHDISELAALTTQLAWLASHDELTSLLNRRGLKKEVDKVRERVTAETPAWVLLLDLDRFKVVNDCCGHEAGDTMLKNIVRTLLESIREHDIIGRTGSDEFAVLLRDVTPDEATQVAQRLIDIIEQYPFVHEGRSFSVSASAGLTKLDRPNTHFEALMAEAGAACDQAKKVGRGRLHVYSSRDRSIVEARSTVNWFDKIQEAIAEHRVQLFLQKVVSNTGRTLGYEALVRLKGDNGDIIAPGDFLPAVRRFGLMTELSQEIVDQAIDIVNDARFPADGRHLAVNIGAASLSDPVFREWFVGRLSNSRLGRNRLLVEITETDETHWTEMEMDYLARIRSLGIPVYLDDFGTGYNSFDLLKTISVDGFKLERALVADIASSPVDRAIVAAASSIASSLDLKLVVEGVEDVEAFEMLKSMGVRRYQGYLFHRPSPASSVLAEAATSSRRSAQRRSAALPQAQPSTPSGDLHSRGLERVDDGA